MGPCTCKNTHGYNNPDIRTPRVCIEMNSIFTMFWSLNKKRVNLKAYYSRYMHSDYNFQSGELISVILPINCECGEL